MAIAENQSAASDDEITIKELFIKISEWWKYLLSNWKILVLAIIAGAFLGLGFSYIKKPVYNAKLSFALQDDKSSNGGIGAAMGLASQFGLDLGGSSSGAFSGDNLMELMKSRVMVESALLTPVTVKNKNQTLAELYLNFNGYPDKWKDQAELSNIHFLPGVKRSEFSIHQDSILGVFYNKIIKNNLTVDKVDKKLSIISIQVKSENEQFSKKFAEILTNTVSNFYIETKTKRSAENVDILQHQVDSVRLALNTAISGVASSTDNNPNANPALQILRVPSLRRQVDVQANTAILGELVKNLEISKMSLRKETPLVQVIDTPILPLEKDSFGKLKGIVLGGLLCGVLVAVFLLLKKILKELTE